MPTLGILGTKGVKQMHPAIEHLIQFFDYGHLPPALSATSRPFCELAHRLADELPENPEKAVALRKLLESKDAAVRAMLERLKGS